MYLPEPDAGAATSEPAVRASLPLSGAHGVQWGDSELDEPEASPDVQAEPQAPIYEVCACCGRQGADAACLRTRRRSRPMSRPSMSAEHVLALRPHCLQAQPNVHADDPTDSGATAVVEELYSLPDRSQTMQARELRAAQQAALAAVGRQLGAAPKLTIRAQMSDHSVPEPNGGDAAEAEPLYTRPDRVWQPHVCCPAQPPQSMTLERQRELQPVYDVNPTVAVSEQEYASPMDVLAAADAEAIEAFAEDSVCGCSSSAGLTAAQEQFGDE